MSVETAIREGQILTGPLFSEPMRVETVRPNGTGVWVAGLVGQQSEQFRRVTLSSEDISNLTIADATLAYDGDGHRLRLGLQAYALGIAYEFDPYFGLSISRVDPLPHQLEAVYEHLLKLPRVRFLLADDAGAGKTIMAGLLVREFKLRGLIERVLVVCPANLTFQWQRELKEKFDEKFLVLKGGDLRDQFGVNQWLEQKQIITSLDLAKRAEILPGLRQVHWDLVIVDEAHRMSARDETHKSLRYRLGELLRDSADHILLLTATPHKGDPQNFTLFLQLLDRDAYADVRSIREAMERRRAPFYLRRTKEAMVYFPERQTDGTWTAKPVFTQRIPRTADFSIDGPEFELYQKITRFVKRQSARAAAQGDDPRARAVGFLMSLYQRRLASSTYAMRRSLENRAKRLEDGLKRAQDLVRTAPPVLPDLEELEEFEDAERERLERMLEAITLAGNAEQVREEIAELLDLAEEAKAVEGSGTEAKLVHLRDIMQDEGFYDRPDQRLLLFTEFKDTLDHLMEHLKSWGFSVGCIHGGMNERDPGWKLPELVARYPRLSTDRGTAEKNNLEWVTPGHPLFEALRRHSLGLGHDAFVRGACFHSLAHEAPSRLDFYRARVVDGLGQVIHERLFTVELADDGSPGLREPDVLGNLIPASTSEDLPPVAALPEATTWLNENALMPFINEVRTERLAEVERISKHVELSLTEVLQRIDEEIGRAAEEVDKEITGAEGRLAQAETRHGEALARRERRRGELRRQRAVTLQGVERLASVLVLPHPERETLDVRRLRPDPETERMAMRVVMEHEAVQGRQVDDVHEKNLGYDVTSIDLQSGELRLIEVKGLAAPTGSILLTPNERRIAEDRRDCYWLYVVTGCASSPELQEPIRDPARFPWHEVTKVAHYWLDVDVMTQPMKLGEDEGHKDFVNGDSKDAG